MPQKEPRKNVAEVLRRAEAGEEFTITVAGGPVAQLGPARRRAWVSGPELAKIWQAPQGHTLSTSTILAPARAPTTRPQRSAISAEPLRFATASGADDGNCHWLISRSRTLCGQSRQPPLEHHQMHEAAPCPNGNPPCPECMRAAAAAHGLT